MKLRSATALLFFGVACVLTSSCLLESDPSSVDCISTQDCSADHVCFFGRCVDPGYNISQVYVDLYPPNSSHLLPQNDSESPRKLVQGLKHDFILRDSVYLEGTITTTTQAQHSGILTATPRLALETVPLPSSQEGIQTHAGTNGFTLSVVPGNYDLKFQPNPGDMPRPPLYWLGRSLTTDSSTSPLELAYPADSELQVINGRLLHALNNRAPITGANVRAITPVGGKDQAISTVITTNAIGQFSLAVGPEVSSYSLSISPGDNPHVPTMLLPNISVSSGSDSEFVLGLGDEKIDVAVEVIKTNNSPEADANVVFTGTVGSEALPGTYTDSIRTNSNGFALTTLFPGLYTITAVPLMRSSSGTQSVVVCVESQDSPTNLCGGSTHSFSEALQLRVPQKRRIQGVVRSHLGVVVRNARVSFSQRSGGISREFTTTTDENGRYELYLDPNHENSTSYELTVEPPASEGLPRYREVLPVLENLPISHDIALYPASFVYGRILNSQSIPLSNVVISFYSTSLGTQDEPLLVGLGRSTENGEFVIALPRLD